MANRWGNNGNSKRFYFGRALKSLMVTVDGNCSHEIERRLYLGRKAIINIDGILKTRDMILPAKVYIVKAMVFSSSLVWM